MNKLSCVSKKSVALHSVRKLRRTPLPKPRSDKKRVFSQIEPKGRGCPERSTAVSNSGGLWAMRSVGLGI